MAETKDTLRRHLADLASQMITNRTENDVRNLLSLLEMAYDDLLPENRAKLNIPHKGAYNYQDLNRVSDFCNTLVTLMRDYYGIDTVVEREGVQYYYQYLPDHWENIKDPTSAQLKQYIDSIVILRDKWCEILDIDTTSYIINQIMYSISTRNANVIEQVLKLINQKLNDYIFSTIPPACGQMLDGGQFIWCGYNIWTGVNQ